MTDTLLMVRLDNLERDLGRLRSTVPLIEEELREQGSDFGDIEWLVDQHVNEHRQTIGDLRQVLANGATDDDRLDAWERLSHAAAEAGRLLSSLLELMGGAAFRARAALDHEILRIADAFNDELVSRAAGRSDRYLTVPASEHAHSESTMQTVRLLFPGWTIWHVPLLGYEFAHVAIEAKRRKELHNLLAEQLELLAAQDAGDADGEPDRRAQRRAEAARDRRVRMLLSDAVATYMLGPCYACATIQLHLDPSAEIRADHATPVERACVVLGCLEQMDAPDDGSREFVGQLAEHWKAAVRSCSRCDMETETARMRHVEETMLPAFVERLQRVATGSRLGKEGWTHGREIEQQWLDNIDKKDPEFKLRLEDKHRLRDVFNGAWMVRLRRPERTADIERVARAASLSLLEQRRTQTRQNQLR